MIGGGDMSMLARLRRRANRVRPRVVPTGQMCPPMPCPAGPADHAPPSPVEGDFAAEQYRLTRTKM